MVLQRRVDISLRRRVSTLTRIALAAGVASIFFPALSFAAQPESPFLLRRGAIVEPVRGAAYVAKPNGTIDAVDLASGRTLWTSDAAMPLGVDNGLLVAQVEEKPRATERLLVVVLDAARGSKISEASIALPAGVRGHVADEKGRWFYAVAERQGANFLISWFYRVTFISGVAPNAAQPQQTRYYAGSARLHPETGRVVAADGGEVSETPGRWKLHGAPPAAPWQVGNVSARTEGGRGHTLTLKRTETGSGRPLPDHVLSKQAITTMPSADQRHVLASERVGEGGPDDPEYRWLIYATDSAEKATELRRDVSAAPYFVFGDSVILESRPHGYRSGELLIEKPLEIHAIRLTTGVPKWEVEVRSLEYRRSAPTAR
jgi:hypothetical protein